MRALPTLIPVVACVALLSSNQIACAQNDEKPDVAAWQTLYSQVARGWTAVPKTESAGESLTLRDEAVMHWSSLDDFNGSVFLWTAGDAPAMVGTVFSFSRNTEPPFRQVVSEFHSLSDGPLQLTTDDGANATLAPGRNLQPLAGAGEPASQPAGRRIQMRRLAGRFGAHMLRDEERWELRLLPQPIYYEDLGEGEVLCRGLFAFVGFVTDPEVLLWLEARQSGDERSWSFQAIRFTNRDYWVRFDDAQVVESLAADESAALHRRQRQMSLMDVE